MTMVTVALPAFAQGDPARGQAKTTACAACHGPEGNTETPDWPKLAGLDEAYIVAQLRAYKSGQRQDPVMSPQAKLIADEDLADLAAFYASKKMTIGKFPADKALFEKGERIYKAGLGGRVTACMVCHGPTGNGHPNVGFTRLGGQHIPYVVAQLRAFRDKRRTDAENIMPTVAAQMTDDEMQAVAAYVHGLSAPPTPEK
jgi:cytochrome c553